MLARCSAAVVAEDRDRDTMAPLPIKSRVSRSSQDRLRPMNDGGYRDARTGILQHVMDLDVAIEQRQKDTTDALFRLLPSALARRIKELEPNPIAEDATLADLSQAAERREFLVGALDEALRLAPSLASKLAFVPDGFSTAPPQEDLWGPVGTEEAIAPISGRVQQIAKWMDGSADVKVLGPRITTRVTIEDVPILWLIDLQGGVSSSWEVSSSWDVNYRANASFLRATHTFSANLSDVMPALRVRHRTAWDAIYTFFTHKHGFEQGDPSFDKTFFVEGDEAFARPLLSEDVRALFMVREKRGAFFVSLGGGRVELVATVSPSEVVYPEVSALSALIVARLRQRATHLELLHSGAQT